MVQNDRMRMLKKLQMYDFVLLELGLFLNSHPEDSEALKKFHMYQKKAEEARMAYTEKYGPISYRDISESMTGWKWIDGPWPWEGAEQ